MIPQRSCILFAAIAIALPVAIAHADYDVRPYLSAGRIVTGGHDDANNLDLAQSHAFGYMFGDDPLSPFAITDPGFNAEAGALTPGAQLNFQVHSALLYWNGEPGPITFSAAPSQVLLDLAKFVPPSSLLDVTLSGDTGPQNGFSIGTVLSDGHIHQHLSSLLSTTDTSTPPDGVYAVEISLLLDANQSTRSDHFYLVWGNGVDDSVLDDAVASLNASPVPEPASLTVLALAAAPLLSRRRRPAS